MNNSINTRQPPLDANQIEAQLFRQSPRYLIAAFSQPAAKREPELTEAATWFGVDAALKQLAPGAPIKRRVEDRWLDLLLACHTKLPNDEAKEVRALVRALRHQAETADRYGSVLVDALWKRLGEELVDELGVSAGHRGTSPATLRSRRWDQLRGRLARVLASAVAQAASQSLLPRAPCQPTLFREQDYTAIRNRLTSATQGPGWAVITGAPSSGSSELALAYATHGLNAGFYDQVFVLRATDFLRLEHDFLMIADLLTGAPTDRAAARRAIFDYLETHDRWLMVFRAVHDPAILLPFLPWNPEGHILCTYATEPEPDKTGRTDKSKVKEENRLKDESAFDPWMRYLNIGVDEGAALSLGAPHDPERTRRLLAATLPASLRDDTRIDDVVDWVHGSRLATALALAWFTHTTRSEGDVEAGEAQIDRYVKMWREASHDIDPGQDVGDREPVPPLTRRNAAYRAGVQAAVVLLSELERAADRESSEAVTGERNLATDALTLLTRLEWFTDEELRASTFPVVLLDDPNYHPNGVDDRRLRLLESLGLASIATGVPHDQYFDVHVAVLEAVRRVRARSKVAMGLHFDEDASLENASRTMLDVMGEPLIEGMPPEQTFQLVPHALALARRELAHTRGGKPVRPFVAIELYARAALCDLARQRVRPAKELMDEVAKIFKEIPRVPTAQPLQQFDDWPHSKAEGIEPRPLIERMAGLVRALRAAGFAPQAQELYEEVLGRVLTEHELHAGPDPEATNTEVARFCFEGAMVYHDLDMITGARDHLERAHAIWERLGDRQWMAVAQGFRAELLFDEHHFPQARLEAEAAKATRSELLDVRDGTKSERLTLLADLARSHLMTGRIAYVEGRLDNSRRNFEQSLKLWKEVNELAQAVAQEREKALAHGREAQPPPDVPQINRVTSLSYLALMEALIGDLSRAGEHAREARAEVARLHPRAHQHSVFILSNVAHVLRLQGRVLDAVREHRRALAVAERTSGPHHRVTLVIRRKCADSLLDAGLPAEALTQLLSHLAIVSPKANEDAAAVGHLLTAARGLSSLGRVLVDSAVTTPPLLSAADRQLLMLAKRILEHARTLYLRAAAQDGPRNPGLVACLTGLSEIAIRLAEKDAEEVARDAYAEAERQLPPGAPPLIAINAKRIRASGSTADVAEVRAEAGALPRLADNKIESARDRLEIALAFIEAETLAWENGVIGDEAAIYRSAQELHEEALAPLQAAIGQAPHQLVARSYAELAGLAERFSMQRQRARNERERDRARPPFDVDLAALEEQLDPLLGQNDSAGLLSDQETRLLERHSTFTRLLSRHLYQDIETEADEMADSVLEIVADNLRKGRRYLFLMPANGDRDAKKVAADYRKRLLDAGVGEAELERCEFRSTKVPVPANIGIYQLDVQSMERQAPLLLQRIRPLLSDENEVGYQLPVSELVSTDALMDKPTLEENLRFLQFTLDQSESV